ncbi:MAG: apolipoprotein N-acyltransferase [Legionella sp.]|nr:apolipoprotein N-acyltransferase [Legionella sp.]
MKPIALTKPSFLDVSSQSRSLIYFIVFFSGLIGPLGFAPFHMPGITLLSIAVFYFALLDASLKQSLRLAFVFGLGFFGLGVSWVIVSIHDYGQINYVLAAIITLIFIMYLSLFPVLVALCFKSLQSKGRLVPALTFSALWCLSEYSRAHFMTGFPWLLLGTTQIDTPLRYLAPVFGIYGLSLSCIFASTLLALAVREHANKGGYLLMGFVLLIISPALLKSIHWTNIKQEPITVAAVQGNLSMRDKWDEALFWSLLKYYEQATIKLLGNRLIILPESAIPLPANYLQDYLSNLHEKTLKANSALILGILQPTDESETHYYNAINAFGHAKGQHLKTHLVPFGEYIPAPFTAINRWFNLPDPNVLPGKANQALIHIFNHPIASLICYETAYPNLLRNQLPQAEWIVSISDNGWFGHSLASYQQLQMSQMLSLLVGRFQVVVNNDGLSSVLDTQGNILEGLPAFSSGILQNVIFPATGSTPWVLWNDYPVLIFCAIWVLFVTSRRICHGDKQ